MPKITANIIVIIAIFNSHQFFESGIDAATQEIQHTTNRPALFQQYPFMVKIWHFNKTICSGTILDEHYILTAAQCFHLISHENCTVSWMERESNSVEANPFGRHSIRISKLYRHPKFVPTAVANNNWSYNVAVVKLETPQPIVVSSEAINQFVKISSKFVNANQTGVLVTYALQENTLTYQLQAIDTAHVHLQLDKDICKSNAKSIFCAKLLYAGGDLLRGGALLLQSDRTQHGIFLKHLEIRQTFENCTAVGIFLDLSKVVDFIENIVKRRAIVIPLDSNVATIDDFERAQNDDANITVTTENCSPTFHTLNTQILIVIFPFIFL